MYAAGVEIEKMLPTPNINLDKIPECEKYLAEGSHRRLYIFSPEDYKEIAAVWGNGEMALPGDPPGELTVVEGMPDGGKINQLTGFHRHLRQITHQKRCSRLLPSSTRNPGKT